MAKRGSHVGRKTEGGEVVLYDKAANRYTVRCNCGDEFEASAVQARNNTLYCAKCWVVKQRAHGATALKMGKGVSWRPWSEYEENK